MAVGLLAALAGLTVVWGVVTLVDLAAFRRTTETFSIEAAPVLVVRTDGDVTVSVGEPGSDVEVVRVVQHGLRAPEHGARTWSRDDRPGSPIVAVGADGSWTGVFLTGECPEVVSMRCSVNYSVVVPPETAVVVDSDGGAVRVDGVEGGVDARSSAGSIVVRDVSGRVIVRSEAGYVRGEELRAVDVEARSSAGSVRLFFQVSPETVVAHSSAGRVEVVVPDDGTSYEVDASTEAGSDVVAIATDPDSDRSIRARSEAGDVLVRHP